MAAGTVDRSESVQVDEHERATRILDAEELVDATGKRKAIPDARQAVRRYLFLQAVERTPVRSGHGDTEGKDRGRAGKYGGRMQATPYE